MDFQPPLIERNLWLNSKIKNWKIMNLALPGRKPIVRTNRARLFASHFTRPPFLARDIIFLHSADKLPPREEFLKEDEEIPIRQRNNRRAIARTIR
jgi:hypothetical protein